MDKRHLLPLLAMPALLLAVELLALLISLPVQSSGIAAFEDPSSLENPLWFILIILIFTALLLVLIRYALKKVITAVIGISIFLTFVYIFAALVYAAMGMTAASPQGGLQAELPLFILSSTSYASMVSSAIVLVLALLATALLYKYPEWYVIDGLGILIAAGVSSIFGVSLDVLPVVVLLVLLAAYDAISVYKTKHMITLAEGVLDQKTPILFVIPKKKDYSFIRDGIGPIAEGEGSERAAMIIGMGDMVMPAILVVSANVFLKGWRLAGAINLPALGAILGSLAGLAVLMHFVMSGKPQAGLPPLCGGTILGFLIGWAAMGLA